MAGDPGRHERFVTVGKDGEKKGLHRFSEDVFISCTQNHQKWAHRSRFISKKHYFDRYM